MKPFEKIAITGVLFVFIGAILLLTVYAAPASAQANNTTADYYNNTTTVVGNASWMAGHEDATLANTTHFLTRLATFVIGDGGSGAAAGTLFTGLIIFGVVGAMTAGSRPGMVGGAVLGVGSIAGLVAAGFAPQWLYAVVLFVLGIIGTAVYRRATR